MSAYIVDPRTIDYLVQWAHRYHPRRDAGVSLTLKPATVLPEGWDFLIEAGASHWNAARRLNLMRVSPDDLGGLLMAENVRSVRSRYPDTGPDDMPGPCDQSGVWRYRFRPIANDLNPAWVVKSCDCLRYQSCETADYKTTLAYAITQAIRDDAVDTLTDDAPWGITDDDLTPKGVAK